MMCFTLKQNRTPEICFAVLFPQATDIIVVAKHLANSAEQKQYCVYSAVCTEHTLRIIIVFGSSQYYSYNDTVYLQEIA